MCGRYALALRPSQVRQMLQDENMRVDDAPDDEGDNAPRQSYNFAPGYHGVVYRADVPDRGGRDSEARPATTTTTTQQQQQQHYKLQSMKWGLIPFWTKRNPDYGAVMKTINCRDDSLAQTGGMWASMKGRKRCVVVAQGFYEWLKSGKEKVPHFVKRKDGKLMLMAGLWDCVKYEDDDVKHYTYTIITTSSNKQLRFLHDRMPVILNPASEQLHTWLDPARNEWSKDLQDLLKPFDGELEVYPVSKEVGKVGNNSPSFIIPVASRENKSNIANFFANAQAKTKESPKKDVKVKQEDPLEEKEASVDEIVRDADDGGMGVSSSPSAGQKRRRDDAVDGDEEPPKKKEVKSSPTPSPMKPTGKGPKTISSTRNPTKSPSKAKGGTAGAQKITKFFGNST